jgi:hypothetical protein
MKATALATDKKLAAGGFPTLASLPDGYSLTALPVGALKIIADSGLVSGAAIVKFLNMSTNAEVRAKAGQLISMSPQLAGLLKTQAAAQAKTADRQVQGGRGGGR